MQVFLKHCSAKHNLIRALKFAITVGTIIALINHFDMFLTQQYKTIRFIQIGITYFVPFFVSILSSALSCRHVEIELKQMKKPVTKT